MADSFVAGPRRVRWMIDCRPGEITHNLCQQAMPAEFTTEELEKIESAVRIELNIRTEKDHVPAETT